MSNRRLLSRMQQIVSKDRYFAAALHDCALAVLHEEATDPALIKAVLAVHELAERIKREEESPFYERPMI